MHEASGTMKPMYLCVTTARQMAGHASRLTPPLLTLLRLLAPLPGRAVRPGHMCFGKISPHSNSLHPFPSVQVPLSWRSLLSLSWS